MRTSRLVVALPCWPTYWTAFLVTISWVSSCCRGARTPDWNCTVAGPPAGSLPSPASCVGWALVAGAGTGAIGGGSTAANFAITRRCRISSVASSSGLPASRQISLRLRRPSTRKKTFHSSGVMVTLCLTRSGLAIASTIMSLSGNTSDRRPRSSMRRLPSMIRFCRSMSRVTAVAGGGTLSQKVKTPSFHSKVSKMTSETWTLRNEASSASVSRRSASSAWPRR